MYGTAILLILLFPFPLASLLVIIPLGIPIVMLVWAAIAHTFANNRSHLEKSLAPLDPVLGSLIWLPLLITFDVMYDTCSISGDSLSNPLCMPSDTFFGLLIRRLCVGLIILVLSWITGNLLRKTFATKNNSKSYYLTLWFCYLLGSLFSLGLQFIELPLARVVS